LQDRRLRLRELKFRGYLALQIGLSVIMLTWFTFFYGSQDIIDKLFYLSFILITLINCGALLEQRHWIYYLEYIRLTILFSYLLYLEGHTELLLLPVMVLIAAEKIFSLSKWYQGYVLQTK